MADKDGTASLSVYWKDFLPHMTRSSQFDSATLHADLQYNMSYGQTLYCCSFLPSVYCAALFFYRVKSVRAIDQVFCME